MYSLPKLANNNTEINTSTNTIIANNYQYQLTNSKTASSNTNTTVPGLMSMPPGMPGPPTGPYTIITITLTLTLTLTT